MKPKDQIRILVVDDQKSMRGLASYYLQQLDFRQIDEAESAMEALKKMQQKAYDVILLDWNMEGMSGIDLLRAIRSVPELNHIKVIMATAERSVEKLKEASAIGANHYVVKPYEIGDLDVRLQKVLGTA
ncbi:response regulator [Chelatococcus sp. SYSU_G07232]|uniref:Response regulator n=1 Tax=Chelatococcus albus TaxID=3047466 RepID=A0ABT7AF88_9HYPH|nr:response regulator [Chelatococcus sp. SYSU_G07232]MDJ1158042.1 response regulator [Chelatococcus sp. SYSU_G07232]